MFRHLYFIPQIRYYTTNIPQKKIAINKHYHNQLKVIFENDKTKNAVRKAWEYMKSTGETIPLNFNSYSLVLERSIKFGLWKDTVELYELLKTKFPIGPNQLQHFLKLHSTHQDTLGCVMVFKMFCKSSWNNSKSFEIILSCLAIGNQSLDAIKILNSIQDKYQPSITVAKNIVQGLLKSGNQELAHAFVEKFDSGVLKSHYDAVCARLYGSDRTVAQWVAFLQVTPDLELATKLIDSFSKNGDYDSVLRIYQAVPSSSRLQACLASAAIVCKQPWKELVSNIEEMELSSYSRLLSSLLFTNNIHDALEIYNQMIKVYSPSAHIICSFLGYYSRMKQPQNVIESYNKFINDGGVPNASVFEILFSVCKNEQNMDPYWKEFDHWLQSHSQKESFASIRLKKNIILSPTLVKFRIRYLVKQKLWSDLEKFIQILNPNENSFYVAQAYLYQILGKAENVDIILASMEQNGFQPTQETFGIQLRAWTRKNNPPKIESIIRKMVSLQIPLQRYHHRDIILGFVSAKKFKKAIRWLHVMKASGFGIAKLKVKVEHEMCIIGNRDFDHLFTSIALDQGLNRWLHQIYPI